VQALDCAAAGRGCGWVDDSVGHLCVDGCGDLDYAGACAGGGVRWCEDGAVHALDCAGGCGWIDPRGYYACL
jgi:hypothetical protein